MKRIFTFLLCISICLPFAFSFNLAKANSGPPCWGGRASEGSSILEENCPIEVEKELLVFNLYDFPTTSGDFIKQSTVTAQYHFFNPMDYDMDVTLAFPVGTMSNSGYNFDDVKTFDSSQYSVKIDGVEQDTVKHYTKMSYRSYNPVDVGLVYKLLKSDLEIDLNTPIYTYFFKNTLGKNRKIKVTIPNVSKNYIILSDRTLSKQLVNNNFVAYGRVGEDEDVFKIVVVGDKPKELSVKYYDDKDSQIEGLFAQDEERGVVEGKFSEIIDESYNLETSTFTKEEYANVFIDILKCDQITFSEGGNEFYINSSIVDDAMVWIVYNMRVEAKGRVVNEVTVPMYPTVWVNGKPYEYEYYYYLSPAKGWASFGELEIVINTDYYLTRSPSVDFEKVANGYHAKLDGLPEGELQFYLCSRQTRKNSYGCRINVYSDSIPLFGVICVLIAYSVIRKRISKTSL